MCLALYVGSQSGLPEQATPGLSVEPLGTSPEVAQWFTQPTVQFVAAPTGCSCGFPHILAESVVEYYDGMFEAAEDRTEELHSVEALIGLLRVNLERGEEIEMYPVWSGDENKAPKGVIELRSETLSPERFFFIERFFYVLRNNHQAG